MCVCVCMYQLNATHISLVDYDAIYELLPL